jgi:hypothetical protein
MKTVSIIPLMMVYNCRRELSIPRSGCMQNNDHRVVYLYEVKVAGEYVRYFAVKRNNIEVSQLSVFYS